MNSGEDWGAQDTSSPRSALSWGVAIWLPQGLLKGLASSHDSVARWEGAPWPADAEDLGHLVEV